MTTATKKRTNDQMRTPRSLNILEETLNEFQSALEKGLKTRAKQTMDKVLADLGVRVPQLEVRTRSNVVKIHDVITGKIAVTEVPDHEKIRRYGEAIKTLGEEWIKAAYELENLKK